MISSPLKFSMPWTRKRNPHEQWRAFLAQINAALFEPRFHGKFMIFVALSILLFLPVFEGAFVQG
jgi:hypothetical protein